MKSVIKDIMEADINIILSTALSSAAYLARLAPLVEKDNYPRRMDVAGGTGLGIVLKEFVNRQSVRSRKMERGP